MASRSAQHSKRPAATETSLGQQVEALDWDGTISALDERGYATTGPLLDADACAALAALYADPRHFRSRVVMQRHAFGRGE
jgi:hypothetical protein